MSQDLLEEVVEPTPKKEDKQFRRFVDYCFYTLLTYFAWSINDNIKEMAVSQAKLTTNDAVQDTRLDNNAKSIVDHETRIRTQENGG